MTPLLSAIYEGHTECVSTLLKHVSKCFCVFPHYRPQTKFAKVMFLHLSVSYSVHRGGGVPGQVPPRQVPPRQWEGVPGQVTPPAGTPPEQVPPWAVTPPPRQVPPLPQQCMLGYGQQAGGTHPTGMHSCLIINVINHGKHLYFSNA